MRRYTTTAEFQLAEVYMNTRFRFEVQRDVEKLEAELERHGLSQTLPSDGTLRFICGRTVMMLIDPSSAARGELDIVGIREQSTDADDGFPPLVD